MVYRIISIAPLLALGACTTSLSTRGDYTTAADVATRGIPYSLPMTQFDIEISRSIGQCFAPNADGTASNFDDVKFVVEVKATPRTVVGETYLIDPTELSGPTKITSLTVDTHESGTLRSVNATSEDRTGPIIGSAVRSVISGAGLAFGIPTGGGGGQPQGVRPTPLRIACTDQTQQRLLALRAASGALATAQDELTATTDRITFLTAQATAGRLTDTERQELVAKLALQTTQAAAVQAAQVALERRRGGLTVTTRMRWPTAFNSTYTLVPQLSTGQTATIAAMLMLEDGTEDDPNFCQSRELLQCVGMKFQTKLSLVPSLDGAQESSVADCVITAATTVNGRCSNVRGMFIRPPGRGRLIACQTVGSDPCDNQGTRQIWASDDIWLPQFGRLRFLPFQNEAFENNSLSVVLRTDGTPERIAYTDKAAQLEGIADAVEDALSQAEGFAGRIRANDDRLDSEAIAESARVRADQLAIMQHEVSRITLQNQLDGLNEPASLSELQSVQAQTQLIAARSALYQAQLAERAALAALAAEP